MTEAGRVDGGKSVPLKAGTPFLSIEKIFFRQDICARNRHQFDKADRKLTLRRKMNQWPDLPSLIPRISTQFSLIARNPRRKRRFNPGVSSGYLPTRDLAIKGRIEGVQANVNRIDARFAQRRRQRGQTRAVGGSPSDLTPGASIFPRLFVQILPNARLATCQPKFSKSKTTGRSRHTDNFVSGEVIRFSRPPLIAFGHAVKTALVAPLVTEMRR